MEIFALEGHKVVVTEETKNNGHYHDSDQVKEHLELGKEYTVDRTDVGGSHTDVYLKEVPNVRFNSVNFEDVVEMPPELRELHPQWKMYNQ